MKIKLPAEIRLIFEAVEKLENTYPDRKFTPDGHLVGSLGEVIAKEALDLELLPPSTPGHDAKDKEGRFVQIKMTSINRISMTANCERLVVLKIVDPENAKIIFDGPGRPAWDLASKMQKNGQRQISLAKLKTLSGWQ